MNSCNFILSEFEELKSCIYCIKAAFTWVRLWGCWHQLLVVLVVVEKTVPFTSKRVCKIQFMSELSNHESMYTLHIAGLRVDKNKSVIMKSWNIVRGERTEVPKFEQRDTIENLLQSKSIHIYTFFPTTPNLSTATDDIGSPNTMSTLTFSRGWVKFNSSLRVSPTSSGYWQFSVASCIEVNSNTST